MALLNHTNKGFMIHNLPENMYTYKSLTDKIAVFLTGHCAEELIFSKENISVGAKRDIQAATGITNSMIKELGYGEVMAYVTIPTYATNDTLFTRKNHEDQVIQIITGLTQKVREVLEKDKKALLKMTKFLMGKEHLRKEEIVGILPQYSTEEWIQKREFIDPAYYFNHNRILEEAISGINRN